LLSQLHATFLLTRHNSDCSRYLLIDSRARRIALVLPSAFPVPLLSTILDTLFINFQTPNVSLLSTTVLTTVAAGLRASLVVDVGWSETIVTSIYEYREVQSRRSIRGSRMVSEEMYKILAEGSSSAEFEHNSIEKQKVDSDRVVSFEEAEEIVVRMAWCRQKQKKQPTESTLSLTPVKEEDELRSSIRSLNIGSEGDTNVLTSIPLKSLSPP